MAHYEDFTIDQGSDLDSTIRTSKSRRVNKRSYGILCSAAKMKKNFNRSASDTVDFTASVNEPPTSGVVTLSLTNLQTDELSTRGRYVYDVEISYADSDGNNIIERVLEGKIKVNPSVTR